MTVNFPITQQGNKLTLSMYVYDSSENKTMCITNEKMSTLSMSFHVQFRYIYWKLCVYVTICNMYLYQNMPSQPPCTYVHASPLQNNALALGDLGLLFIRGLFWPSGIVIGCVCVSVCVCINHELVRMITHRSLKLESPNLDHRCKNTLV